MRHIFALGALALTLGACHSDAKEQAAYALGGQVVSEAGDPVAGASLKVGSKAVVADANGNFTAQLDQASDSYLTLAVSATGFAGRAMRVQAAASKPAAMKIVLRPEAAATMVTVPNPGEPDATVTATTADSQTTVSIGAGVLVDATGAAVTGTVAVKMTYWNPAESMRSAPGSLVATEAGTAQTISSLGMADISATQNDAPLQVAAGKTLGWSVTLSPSSKAMVASNAAILNGAALYALDMNSATFEKVAPYGAGVTYDATTGILAAGLPHLSTWNYDYGCGYDSPSCVTTSNGGCVQGMVYDCNGKVLPAQAVQIWATGASNRNTDNYYGVLRFTATTDVTGRYCATLGIEYGYASQDVPLYVSGPDNVTQSNRHCPIDTPCAACDQAYPWCSGCVNGTTNGQPSGYTETYTLQANTFCPDVNCTKLPDLYLGYGCQNTGKCDGYPLQVGAKCDVNQVPNGCCDTTLHCSDGACIPNAGGY